MENTYTVYVHISPSRKRYVGITSCDVKIRWGKNGYGYRDSVVIKNAIQKYGWNNFEHYILFENVSEKFAKNKEIELILLWKTYDRNFGYNVSKGGDLSQSKPVDAYDLYGNFIDTFSSASAAASQLGLSISKITSISDCCKGKQFVVSKKYIFRYKGEPFNKYKTFWEGKKTVPISQYDLSGSFIKKYKSALQASKENNLGQCQIYACCTGIHLTCGGYIWRYDDEPFDKYRTKRISKWKQVVKYDFYGNKLEEFENCSLASQATQRGTNIDSVCRGLCPSSGGFVWRYKKDSFNKYNFDYSNHYEVCQFDFAGNLLKIYSDIYEAKNITKIRRIKECCKNKCKTAGGYIWKFLIDCTEIEIKQVEEYKNKLKENLPLYE